MLTPRRIDDDGALAAVREAFEIELGGQAFYHRAARDTAEPALRELFGKLADMELEHMATLSRRYHAKVPTPSESFHLDRAALFGGVDNRPEDPANLLRIAIAFERRAVEFFEGRGAVAAEDSPEKALYRELAAEEREHAALLTTEYQRWTEGKPGML